MSVYSRRDAVKALAAGAAVGAVGVGVGGMGVAKAGALGPSGAGSTDAGSTGVGSLGTGSLGGEAADIYSKVSPEAVAAARDLLRATAPGLRCGPGARNAMATALLVASWDDRVYLTLNDGTSGVVVLTPAAKAIVAACAAANRQCAVRVWGHDAKWAGNVGRFDGALVAMSIYDLPSDGVDWANTMA